MNKKITYPINAVIMLLVVALTTSCNDYLDREPLSNVTPNEYLWSEADLAAYTINRYSFPTHGGWGPGTFSYDNHTDNQATSSYSNQWVPGEWRVPQSGGSWNFSNIRNCNYFLQTVVPRWKTGEITGNAGNIAHYIGEAYFLRAYEYFTKVQAFGDFPIVKRTLNDTMDELTEASKRRPRNEIARFILADLDSAIMLLKTNPPYGKNRISQHSAYLMKSRVALHEASWLKYLDDNNLSENTLVVYTSDQGFYMGEHGWFDKRFMYEESFRTPLLMRFPKNDQAHGQIRQLVQNIDYAPTLLELAGVPIPEDIQGESLLPLVRGEQTDNWRKGLYYHYYEYPGEHAVKRHYGIRTDRYKLIHFYNDLDEWELYDLQNDPTEMHNLCDRPEYQELVDSLKTELRELQLYYKEPHIAQ